MLDLAFLSITEKHEYSWVNFFLEFTLRISARLGFWKIPYLIETEVLRLSWSLNLLIYQIRILNFSPCEMVNNVKA